jgi:hypothetical protein
VVSQVAWCDFGMYGVRLTGQSGSFSKPLAPPHPPQFPHHRSSLRLHRCYSLRGAFAHLTFVPALFFLPQGLWSRASNAVWPERANSKWWTGWFVGPRTMARIGWRHTKVPTVISLPQRESITVLRWVRRWLVTCTEADRCMAVHLSWLSVSLSSL